MKFAFERWYDDDPEAAQTWLASMPDAGVADPAHLMVALLEEPRDPVRAAEAALRIREPDMRLDTFGKVLLPELSSMVVYALMALVLLWRPHGLVPAPSSGRD